MQARTPLNRHSTYKWQHVRIVVGIIIVCSGWGLLMQTATHDKPPSAMHDTASHPA